jgi:hypothetical protein
MITLKCIRTALGLMSTALAKAALAFPVPAYDSSTLLDSADTVLVGEIVNAESGTEEGQISLAIRVDRPIKGIESSSHDLVQVLSEGPRLTSLTVGTRGLFLLKCHADVCRPLNSFRPYWPAVQAEPVPVEAPEAERVSTAVLAELVAVIAAGDNALAAATGEGVLTPGQAEERRSVAIGAIATLPRAQALIALHAVGRPSDDRTRLAVTAAELKPSCGRQWRL